MAGIVAVSRDVGTAGLRSSCQVLQKANLTVRCPLPNPLPRGEGIEDAEPQPFWDFQPILFPLPVGEG